MEQRWYWNTCRIEGFWTEVDIYWIFIHLQFPLLAGQCIVTRLNECKPDEKESCVQLRQRLGLVKYFRGTLDQNDNNSATKYYRLCVVILCDHYSPLLFQKGSLKTQTAFVMKLSRSLVDTSSWLTLVNYLPCVSVFCCHLSCLIIYLVATSCNSNKWSTS